MSGIERATTPEVPEPQPGTWSNCLVAGGIAYVAGMTASGGDLTDEYTQSKAIFTKIRHLVEAAGSSMADIVTVTIFVAPCRPTAAQARPSGPSSTAGAMLWAMRLPAAGEFGLPGVRSNRDMPWPRISPRPSMTTAEPNSSSHVVQLPTAAKRLGCR